MNASVAKNEFAALFLGQHATLSCQTSFANEVLLLLLCLLCQSKKSKSTRLEKRQLAVLLFKEASSTFR
jgi:hypothetical protein